MIRGLVKQREDSIFQFRKANRPELVEKEEAELAVLRAYLPAEASDAEIEKAVEQAVTETGAASAEGHRQGDEGGAGRARGDGQAGGRQARQRRRPQAARRLSRAMKESVRKVGQRFMVGFDGLEASADVKRLIREYGVGHIIYFARNVASPEQVAGARRASCRRARATPATICRWSSAVDQEGGRVARMGPPWTVWPPLRGARPHRVRGPGAPDGGGPGRASAWPAASTATSSPILDVDTNPENPIIGNRSFGADPDLVGRLGAAMIRGLQGKRVIGSRQALSRPRGHRQGLAPRAARRRPSALAAGRGRDAALPQGDRGRRGHDHDGARPLHRPRRRPAGVAVAGGRGGHPPQGAEVRRRGPDRRPRDEGGGRAAGSPRSRRCWP